MFFTKARINCFLFIFPAYQFEKKKSPLSYYLELLYFSLHVTLREVLYVGELEIHLRQPHQNAVPGRLELLPLANEVLERKEHKWKSHRLMLRRNRQLQPPPGKSFPQ